jgi:FkbM family methyltransferase
MPANVRRLVGDVRSVWRTADRASSRRWTVGAVRSLPAILRSRTLVPADKSVSGLSECTFCVSGVSVTVPAALFSGAREMYCRGVYWPIPEFLPRPGYTVVDLGANVGLFSLYSAAAGATVVSVEAQSGFGDIFDRLMSRNGVSERTTFVHALVGEGTGVLSSQPNRREASHWGSESPRRTIAEILAATGSTHVDLCKIDIEGSEFDLFDKDSQWLDIVDRLVMEVHSDFGDPEILVSKCLAAGFEVTRMTSDMRPVPLLAELGLIHAIRRGRSDVISQVGCARSAR